MSGVCSVVRDVECAVSMWCVNGAREKAEKNIVSVRVEVSLRWPG